MCMEYIQKYFFSLKIKNQVLLQVTVTVSLILIVICGIVNFSFLLISQPSYKKYINILEKKEVEEVSFVTYSIESAYIYFKEGVFDFLRMMTNLYKNFEKINNNTISEDYFRNIDLKLYHKDEFNTNIPGFRSILFYSTKYSLSELKLLDDFKLSKRVIYTMFPMIKFINEIRLFLETNKRESQKYFEQFMILDFKNELVFLYPARQFNITKQFNLAEFAKDNVQSSYIIDLNRFKNLTNSTFVNDKFLNDDYFFRNTPQLIETTKYNEFFNTKDKNINNHLVTSNYFTQGVNLSQSNLLSQLNSGVYSLFQSRYVKTIIDDILSSYKGESYLHSSIGFPYLISSNYFCNRLRYRKDLNYSDVIGDKRMYLNDCFTSKSYNPFLRETLDDKEMFFNEMDLKMSNDIAEDNEAYSKIMEEDWLIHQTNYKKIYLDNKQYKVKRTIFPLSTSNPINNFNYFYPITNLELIFYLKDQGTIEQISKLAYKTTIAYFTINFAWTFFFVWVVFFYIFYFILDMMDIVEKPIILINNAIQTISILDDFKKAKRNMEIYILQTDDEKVEEFKELIGLILDMIEGKVNNDIQRKNDLINLHDFEMVKMNNYVLLEDIINERMQRSSYLNEILSVNINDIFEDDSFKLSSGKIEGILRNSCAQTNSNHSNRYNDLKYINQKFNEDQFKIGKVNQFEIKDERGDYSIHEHLSESKELFNFMSNSVILTLEKRKNSFLYSQLESISDPLKIN
jgi:hypothetical protein